MRSIEWLANRLRPPEDSTTEAGAPGARAHPWPARGRVGWALLLAITLAIVLAPPLGLSSYDKFFIATVAIGIILALSLNLAWGYTGLVSLVHTGLYAVGAYTSGVLAVKMHLTFWLGLPAALALGAVVGAVIAVTSLRASSLYFAMITFAFDLILIEIANHWTPVTGGQIGTFGIPKPSAFGHAFTMTDCYYLVWLATALTLGICAALARSRFGRAFVAVRDAPDAAAALGISPFRTRLLSFTISAALAALAGSLFAHVNGFIDPSAAGFVTALNLFVAILFGGAGTLFGPILGGGVVAEVQRLLQPLALYQALIFGVFLLVAVSVLPAGIVGTWRLLPWGRPDLSPPRDLPPAGGDASSVGGRAETVAEASRAASADLADRPIVLEARGIHKSFRGLKALDGVDLVLRAGEIHGLIGPNGSGKSTLVNVISGYYARDAGTVVLDGRPLGRHGQSQAAAAGLIRVFQIPHLFTDLTVLENMLIGLHLKARQTLPGALLRLPGFRREERRLRATALGLLAALGLAEKANWPAGILPHGQQRMLEVARAASVRPRLLVLDEPATGLTREDLHRLAALIRRVRDEGSTVLLIEHNMGFVMGLCDRITVLENGRVIAEGTPDEVQRSPAVIEAYLGTPAADVRA
jgi:ABC-type branched-subunit amino acid transport system ATPase component/ABC-type branched-subunit amino acid transport system permease subunit